MATPSVQDLLQQIETIASEKQTLEGQLSEANQKAEDLGTQLSEQTTKVADLEGKLSAETAKVTEIQASLTKVEGEVQTLKETAKSAEQRGQEIAASFGVTAGKKPADAQTGGGQTMAEQLAAITDPNQRTEFYRKNKAAIRAEAMAQR